jgi:predicted phage tail protein
LQKQFLPIAAAFVLTGFWALWHLPLFLYRPGYTSMDVAGIVGWILSLLMGRFILSWFQNAASGSILICAVFHATIDVAFTSGATTQELSGYIGVLVTLWGLAMLIPLKMKKLSAKGKLKQSQVTTFSA